MENHSPTSPRTALEAKIRHKNNRNRNVEKTIESPNEWGYRTNTVPAHFPSIKFNGYEGIRFVPGWSKPDSAGFWTYKMVRQIDEAPQLTEERLADLIKTYFDGLSRVVVQGDKRDLDTLRKPVAVFTRHGDSFCGRLRIYDAFTTKDWIYLNVMVYKSKRGDKHLIALDMSPKPFEHQVWTKLNMVRIKTP